MPTFFCFSAKTKLQNLCHTLSAPLPTSLLWRKVFALKQTKKLLAEAKEGRLTFCFSWILLKKKFFLFFVRFLRPKDQIEHFLFFYFKQNQITRDHIEVWRTTLSEMKYKRKKQKRVTKLNWPFVSFAISNLDGTFFFY